MLLGKSMEVADSLFESDEEATEPVEKDKGADFNSGFRENSLLFSMKILHCGRWLLSKTVKASIKIIV